MRNEQQAREDTETITMKITEQARITQHLGIARRTGVTATLTLPEWEQTIADFDGLCAYCLTQPFTLLEHFLPVNIAGTHVKNCLPACHGCNQRKGNRTSDELVAAFGLATIERIQQYLASRSEQTDKPAPTLARRTS